MWYVDDFSLIVSSVVQQLAVSTTADPEKFSKMEKALLLTSCNLDQSNVYLEFELFQISDPEKFVKNGCNLNQSDVLPQIWIWDWFQGSSQ